MKTELIWAIHLFKKNRREKRDDRNPLRISWFKLAMRYLKKEKSQLKFTTKRSSHFGWVEIPELILSPRHFDFARPFPDNQIHMGPVVDIHRKEDQCQMEKVTDLLDVTKKKVFCSMGSYDFKYCKERIRFFVTLINVFLLRKDWQLILSTGNDIDPSGFRHLPSNVCLFQSVPQLHLLKNVDLMISHAGMQSVTECILLETPMLVFPLNPDLDQYGNAARVVYHKLGIRGKLNQDSPKDLEMKINQLLTKRGFYLRNIQELKQKMLASDDFEKGIAFIESFIQIRGELHGV
ncbi:glycosyltransferase [Pleomorphovibrio marinus]|uniref:glycosyltransferase n=1 Tax=Pleomorphovibrio marinus TaxID=2164132 RepID=UPI0018E5756B|nr:glycosyltransferase [Pleomorphovibrio marinus]